MNILNQPQPLIVVSLGGNTTTADINFAKQNGMDIAEVRADLLANPELIISQLAGVPIILTIRVKDQGGQWQQSETKRIDLFKKLIPLVDLVDIELTAIGKDEIVTIAKQHNKLIIFSQHNFTTTPEINQLDKLIVNLPNNSIFKIATWVNNNHDLLTLVQFLLNNCQHNLVVIGMGEVGLVSRIFFPSLGSKLTFTFVGSPTAPGQMDLLTTKNYIDFFYTNTFKHNPTTV